MGLNQKKEALARRALRREANNNAIHGLKVSITERSGYDRVSIACAYTYKDPEMQCVYNEVCNSRAHYDCDE